jgi:hypothetical protein
MRLRSCGSAREVAAAVVVVVEAVEEAVEAAVEEAAAEPAVEEEVGFHHLHLGPSQDQSHAQSPNPARRPVHVPIPNHALDPNRVLV